MQPRTRPSDRRRTPRPVPLAVRAASAAAALVLAMIGAQFARAALTAPELGVARWFCAALFFALALAALTSATPRTGDRREG